MLKSLPLMLLLPVAALADAPQLQDAFERPVFQQAPPPPAPVAPAATAPSTTVQDAKDGREFLMEMGFRGRMVSVPKSIMDIWYFDDDDEGWAYTEGRPSIQGYAVGLEFVVKNESNNGIFYFEYLDSQMEEGYWDDREEPEDHLDGDFLVPRDNLGLVAIGADYAYEAWIVSSDQTNGSFGLSFLVGGGLGVAFMTGQLDRWEPDDAGNPAYKRYLEGEPAVEQKSGIPRVLPMVDVNAGLRFQFGDRLVVRAEGGLHTVVYYGTSVGLMF